MANERGYYVIRDFEYSVVPTEAQVELVRQRLRGDPAEWTTSGLSKNTLDLYLPTTAADGRSPVVVFIHGGGWRRGDKTAWNHFLSLYDTNFLVFCILWLCNMYGSIGASFARCGVACVVINYPLARLSFPFSIIEMFTSFVFTASFWLFVVAALAAARFLLSTLYVAIITLVEPYLSNDFLFIAEDTWQRLDDSVIGQWRDAILSTVTSMSLLDSLFAFIAGTQAVTWLFIAYRLQYYRISPVTLVVQVVAFACLLQRLHAHDCELHTVIVACCLFLLVTVQGTIYTRRYVLVLPAHYPDNVNAVADSIRWTKVFGEKTGLYRSDRLFLMGHSAGGHLASCVALHGAGRTDRLAIIDDIKGVLSLSAIYELTPLYDTFVSRYLYLLPTFGRDRSVWLEASPVLQLVGRRHRYVPPFLVVTASWDCSLNHQADHFLQEYRRYSGHNETSRHVIPYTNHIDIIWRFRSHELLKTRCMEFIESVVRRLDVASESQREDDPSSHGLM